MSESLISAGRYLVGIQSETVYGEDAFDGLDPTTYLAFDEFTPTTDVEIVEDNRVKATHSGNPHDVYDGAASVSWSLPVTGIVDPSGTPSFPLGDLLKASNWGEVVGIEPSYEYNLMTGCNMDDVPSVTAVLYQIEQARTNARKRVFTGLRGNTTLNLSMGEPAMLSGDYTGLYTEFPVATVPTPANPASYAAGSDRNRFICVGMNITVGGTPYSVENVEFSTGWDVQEERDGTTAETTLSFVFLTRAPGSRVEGSTTLKGRSQTFANILPAVRSGAEMTFEAVLENQGGDRFTIEAPAVQFGSYSENRDGNISFDLPLNFNGTGAGENEVTLKVDRK